MRHAQPAVAAASPADARHVAGWAAYAALLLALTLPYPSATLVHAWPWALPGAIVWLVPAAFALVALTARESRPWPNRILPAGIALLVVVSAVSARLSPFADASLVRLWPTLGGAALFVGLRHWLSRAERTPARMVILGTIAAGIAAIVILFSFAMWWRGQWPLPWGSRNRSPFGHSNYTAGFVVLAFPWLAWSAWRGAGPRRAASMAVMLVALVVLASTSSRGGALAFGFTALAAGVVIGWRSPWSVRSKALLAIAMTVLAGAVILANPRLRALVLERSWSDGARASNVQREAMFDAGLMLGRARPWLGWGPGSVPLAYPRVRAELDGGVDNVLQLHNTPLQLWATLGIGGLLALALLAVGAVHAVTVGLRTGIASPERFAALASLGGYALFALTDHQFDVPLINAMAAANLAILSASGLPAATAPAASGQRRRSIVRLGLAGALMVLALPLWRDLRARRDFSVAIHEWDQHRISDRLTALDNVALRAPYDPYYQHHAASACLQARQLERDPAQYRAHTRAAVERLEASLRTGVHQEFAHFNLGWLNLDLERPIAAARHFIAAARLVPDKGGVYFGLGLALQSAGDTPQAVRAFALEWVNDPLSMSSPAWEVPLLAPLRPAVRAETLRIYAQLAAELPRAASAAAWARWWLGEPVDPRALAAALETEAREFAAALPAIEARAPSAAAGAWAKAYAAWREPEALPRFMAAAGSDPAFAAALQRRARRHRESFHAFLAAPTEDEAALLQTYRRERLGYGALAWHPDGPTLLDAYTVQQNRVATAFAAPLLPAKGWLPGRFLLQLLPTPRDLAAAK